MNYMAEVAKMLGVNLNEEFDVCFDNSNMYMKAKITENGFKVIETNMVVVHPNSSCRVFEWILCGITTIKRKPWKPQEDEEYYIVLRDGSVGLRYWDDCTHQINSYKIGNCYRTKEEALANRDKWIAFYASDDVFEVRHD